jgi:hypothetical protein
MSLERKTKMNSEQEVIGVGSHLGNEAAEHIAKRAEDYCECERQRIELSNEARINALYVEGSQLIKLERQIEERLRLAPPSGDVRIRKRRACFYWFTGIVLTVAAFLFSVIALGPFRLGWYGNLYCLGIGLVTPFAIEAFLDAWKIEKLLKALVTLVFVSAISGGALLATIRGDLLSQQIHETAPAVVIEGEAPSPLQLQNSFYDSTHGSLRMLMMLLALAIDLGGGVAIQQALLTRASSGDDFVSLSRELADTQSRLAAIVFEMTELQNAPGIFVTRFWRDFYRAMLTQTVRHATTKLLGLMLCLLLLGSGRASGQERLNLVVAVDLTASEAITGQDGRSQFSKNLEGVRRTLASVPAGSKVTVIGITGNSFSQPYILLSADITDDRGYFGERLAAARQQLLHAWQKRSAQLEPNARTTDVFGALLVASALFQEARDCQKKMLVLYSDMRHVTPDLDLESPAIIHVDAVLAAVEKHQLLADLRGVEVFVLGADAAGKRLAQWKSLKQFWMGYFKEAGAALSGYTILCEPPRLEQ